MLNRITYPTGGYSHFHWEGHDYGFIGTSSSVPTSLELVDKSVNLTLTGFDGTVSRSFTVGGTQTVSASLNISTSAPICPTCVFPPSPYTEITGPDGFWRKEWSSVSSISLEPGNYTLKVNDQFSGYSYSATLSWDEEAVGTASSGASDVSALAGGVRIARIEHFDGTTSRDIYYEYSEGGLGARSSGIVGAEPRYNFQFSGSGCSYHSRSAISKQPLGAGPVVGYKEVWELFGVNGQFGRVRHAFTGHHTDPDQNMPSTGTWPFNRPTSQAWKRGLELESDVKSAAGVTQQRVTRAYTHRDEGTEEPLTTTRIRGISMNWLTGAYGSTAAFASPFQVISAWSYLDTETTTVFDTSGSGGVSTTRSWTYGNPQHAQPTSVETIASDGVMQR
ncbi:MAG: hypothetical protein RQ745_07970, partial [Longimicrobiales bacterium]|nr:hypothetical protein [Longimicrobiales bacterium]